MKPSKNKIVRLGIIGTGGMANCHAENYRKIPDCTLVAATDVVKDRVEEFCKKHSIPNAYTNVDELLAREDIDAVSIVTPDGFHAPLSIKSLKAGKHVLCEKPLAVTYPDALKMVAAAKKAGKINMVNFSYRDWPVIHAVAKLVQSGAIGEIRHVEANYLQSWLTSTGWGDWTKSPGFLWRLSIGHGSKGVLGDIGVHILDFATYPVGPISSVYCKFKNFPKAPRNRVGEYILDANDSAAMTVEFKNGALGVIHTSRYATGHNNRLFLQIAGTKGAVLIDSEVSTTKYRICKGENIAPAKWEEVEAPAVLTNYQRFVNGILKGKQDQPDFARGAEIQKILDTCFVSDKKAKPIKL